MSSSDNTPKHRPPKPEYRFKRNTLPPLLGLLTFTATIVALNFQWIFAQFQYKIAAQGTTQIVSIDTSSTASTVRPNEAPSLWIPKIDIHAPIIFESSTNEADIQKSLRQGVVHYPMTAIPGEIGNVVVFGHSSGQPWAPGAYKFIFTLLNKVQKDDQIVIDFEGIRYVYSVKSTEVVDPHETRVLLPTGKPTLTLITCTPVGTSNKRLVVTAEQVSPKLNTQQAAAKPKAAKKAPKVQNLPSNSPAFWQSLINLF